MKLIKKEDILHKAQLLKVLTEVVDNSFLSSNIHFKGGTCAAMLGYLDRFSVDLDFDLKLGADKKKVLREFNSLFGMENKNLMYVLKYDAPKNQRNTLKLSVSDKIVNANTYKTIYLPEIDRQVSCQTIETMFANKLVAPIDRFEKHEKIAGRDVYDIHHFFLNGYPFKEEIIEERTGLKFEKYIKKLIKFIETKVTQKVLSDDLNTLLPYEKFQKIRKTLVPETLLFLRSID